MTHLTDKQKEMVRNLLNAAHLLYPGRNQVRHRYVVEYNGIGSADSLQIMVDKRLGWQEYDITDLDGW